jgi:hypothetical protein
MISDDDELAAQIANTFEFIEADPIVVTLIPRVRQNTPTGARFTDQPARDPQRFKLISQSGLVSGSGRPTVTIDGVERVIEFVLMGMPDVVVARYDYWVQGGQRFEVLEIQPTPEYEVKALVERRN